MGENMVDSLSRQDNEGAKIEVVANRPRLVVHKRMFAELSVFSLLIKIAVHETRAPIASHMEQSFQRFRSDAHPTVGGYHKNGISLTSVHRGHEIAPTRETLNTDGPGLTGKPLHLVGVRDNHGIDPIQGHMSKIPLECRWRGIR